MSSYIVKNIFAINDAMSMRRMMMRGGMCVSMCRNQRRSHLRMQ